MRNPHLAIFLLLCCPFAPAQQRPASSAAAAAPTRVAEGAYEKWNTWTLSGEDAKHWVADINMQVYQRLAEKKKELAVQKETLRMDGDFTMRGFRYESRNFGAVPDGALDCTVLPASLDCVSTFPGQSRGKGKINVSGGYATQFGVEIALLDMPWFFTTLVAQSDRDPKQPRTLGIVTIAFDGQTPDTLVTGGAKDADVSYVGVEKIQVLGRSVSAHKFQIGARTYEATVWTAPSGLLLAADWGGMRIELSRYKQWAPLVPEFPIEDRPNARR